PVCLAIKTRAQRMKTAVRPVRTVRARCRWAAFRAIWSRWSDIATKTRPVRAAAPPPTVMKKSCQAAASYMAELSPDNPPKAIAVRRLARRLGIGSPHVHGKGLDLLARPD